jgi:hypothetical protein
MQTFYTLTRRPYRAALAYPVRRRVATLWQEVPLRQYINAHQLCPQGATDTLPELERLCWQVVFFSNASFAELARLSRARLLALAEPVLALWARLPAPEPASAFTLQGQRYEAGPQLGEEPLAKWLYLEREFLQAPTALSTLPEAAPERLPRLLALLATPPGADYDARQFPGREQTMQELPVPSALAVHRWLLAELAQLQEQYSTLFGETGGGSDAWQDYCYRWGWHAALAELNGGPLTPARRQELLGAPIHLVFQELARLTELNQLRARQARAAERQAAQP